MKLIEQRLGIRFEVIQTQTWAENLRLMQTREVDAFPIAAKTLDRLQYARFTDPYISYPAVILVASGAYDRLNIEDLHG